MNEDIAKRILAHQETVKTEEAEMLIDELIASKKHQTAEVYYELLKGREGMAARDDGSVWALVNDATINGSLLPELVHEAVRRHLVSLRTGWGWWTETTFTTAFDGVKHELPGGQVVWLNGLPTSRWRKP